MSKKSKSILIDEDVYKELIKKRGAYEANSGARLSLSDFIKLLLEKQ